MNLDEFKKELTCENDKKILEMSKTIKRLNKTVEEKDSEISELNDLIRQLTNRCYVLTQGTMCMWCGCKDKCNSDTKSFFEKQERD